jgi:hypothetical protein
MKPSIKEVAKPKSRIVSEKLKSGNKDQDWKRKFNKIGEQNHR